MSRTTSKTRLNGNHINSSGKREKKKTRGKKISENFMFTQTLDPFEVKPKWWEKQHVKYAFNYSPVKSRLAALMGSYVVRLTDRKYIMELKKRIRQDYQLHKTKRIEERQEAELMRIKKLILKGIIDIHAAPEEIKEYPIFQLYLYSNAIVNELNKKKVIREKNMVSLHNLLYPEGPIEAEEIFLEKSVRSSTEQTAESKDEADEEIEKQYMMTEEECEIGWYTADVVKELADIHGLESVYSKAQEVVGVLFSDVDAGRFDKSMQSESTNKAETD